MIFNKKINVAAPWGLSHYIPLNGFHPLYRPLFENAPKEIQINTWDNIKLDKYIKSLKNKSKIIHSACKEKTSASEPIDSKFQDYFWYPNKFLTKALPGNIEFHHTAPYASLNRPFIFHCESFAPIFFPLTEEGRGNTESFLQVKQYYNDLFENDKCLAIFSHIPETLNFISNFFKSNKIDKKLKSSRIGLCDSIWNINPSYSLNNSNSPIFLFVNSANQNPNNFFTRGGHIILRFWQKLIKHSPAAKLIMRCTKPSNELLINRNIDVKFIKEESNKSILWIENYITQDEQNTLMSNADFFLLPSISLHSVSLMQAMKLGAIPIVTDTIGTNIYVNDNHGIVLCGVKEELWQTNDELGISFNSYESSEKLTASLEDQMLTKTIEILNNQTLYDDIKHRMRDYVLSNFSGQKYSEDFWQDVLDTYKKNCQNNKKILTHKTLSPKCLLNASDIPRVFESPTQPLIKLCTGYGKVYEFGGAYIYSPGKPKIELNDWSVLSRYINKRHADLRFANSLQSLNGCYLSMHVQQQPSAPSFNPNQIIRTIAAVLKPFPILYKYARKNRSVITNISKYIINKTFGWYEAELKLIMEGYFDYNIVHYYKYYALPIDSGAYNTDRLLNSKKTLASSYSLEKLLKTLHKDK